MAPLSEVFSFVIYVRACRTLSREIWFSPKDVLAKSGLNQSDSMFFSSSLHWLENVLHLDISDMLTMHYYLLFDGPDELWHHTKNLYDASSTFSFSEKISVGPNDIFASLSNLRRTLAGDWPTERLVHIVEKLQCRPPGQCGIAIRVSGSFIIGNQFLICGEGVQQRECPISKMFRLTWPAKGWEPFRSSL